MKLQHIMLDLETLGTKPGSIILSIGAVKFGSRGITEKFYCSIDEHDSSKYGLTSDPSTCAWWEKQSEEARSAAFKGEHPLKTALQMFTDFCGGNIIRIWGNGSDFDNVLLEEAYRATNMGCPWKFTGNRCYRTLKNTFTDVSVDSVGVEHNAMWDAVYQATHLIAIAKKHRLKLS